MADPLAARAAILLFVAAGVTILSVPASGATNSGVLARLQLTATGSGISPLNLKDVKLTDGAGDRISLIDASAYYAGPIIDGTVAYDNCADGPPDRAATPCQPTSTPI